MSNEILESIKGIAKEGSDLTSISEQINGLNPLAKISTKEEAWGFIKDNPLLASTFDSKVGESTQTFESNLRSGKLADEWKEKEQALRAELNPTESEADKSIRELNDKINAMENKEKLSLIQDNLSKKASELGYDPMKARDFAIYGDQALEKLEADSKWIDAEVEKRLAVEIKNRFTGGQQPKKTAIVPADIDSKIMEARKAGDNTLALRLQMSKNKK